MFLSAPMVWIPREWYNTSNVLFFLLFRLFSPRQNKYDVPLYANPLFPF